MDEKEIKDETVEETKEEIVEETKEEIKDDTVEEANEEISEDEFDDTVIVSKAEPLPIYGQGIFFILMVAVLTILAVVFGHVGSLKTGVPSAKWLRYAYIFLGFVVGFLGFSLYLSAINEENMIYKLRMGKLITTGVYSRTRNPVYGGIILIATAILFFSGNVYMYVLPFIEAFILFVWIGPYEDHMLRERFGEEYDEYRKTTHFLLPNKKTDVK